MCGAQKTPVRVLVEAGIAEYPTSESHWRALGQDEALLSLIKWDRPEG
jgi:hypothetical protein